MIGDLVLTAILLFCVRKLYQIEHRLTRLENDMRHLRKILRV